MIKKLVVFAFAMFLFSCNSTKRIVYLSNGDASSNASGNTKYASVLQPDDNLLITVTADEPALAAPFNMMYLIMQSNEMTGSGGANNMPLISYLIDQNGEIDFPQLGKIKLAGLTRIEAENKLKELLKKQIQNPGVNLRILNYKVSVLGEVMRPGPVPVVGERITILEALSQAGDMTIYGLRKEVMVIREVAGVQSVAYVDITDANIINSPYYYLSRNDVIYVKPNKTRVNSSVIGPNLTVGISALSLLVTIIALSTR